MEELVLIGNPIAHSISPLIHNTILKGRKTYGLELVKTDELQEFVRKFDGIGFNITAPHKTEIMRYLDEISQEAREIGAVNTVKRENGRLVGYNTDAAGFLRQLEHDGVEIVGKTIKIIGTGGSSCAIEYILNKNGAKNILKYNRSNIKEFTPVCDVLINATPVGTYPDINEMAVDIEGVLAETAVVDIIYNPRKTKLMQIAEEMGCRTYNGLKMLVFQAIIAEEIWFGEKIPEQVLEEILNVC